MGEENLLGNEVREKRPDRTGLCKPQSGSVWMKLRVRWKPLEATDPEREGTLFPDNNLNHLQVVTIPNP